MALALTGVHPASGRAQPGVGLPVAPAQAAASAGGIILPQVAPPSRPVRHLSVDEAVTLALEQNLDLRVERINPLIQDTAVAEARSVYAPTLSTTLNGNERDRPAGSIFDGGDVVTRPLPTGQRGHRAAGAVGGGQYSAQWIGGRSSSTNVFNQYNPYLPVEPEPELHPAAGPRLRHRRLPPAYCGDPREPGPLRHRPPACRRLDGTHRPQRLLAVRVRPVVSRGPAPVARPRGGVAAQQPHPSRGRHDGRDRHRGGGERGREER